MNIMKNLNKFLALFMATTLFAFMTSCDDDDPVVPTPVDPTDTTDVILVADGYYLAKDGESPVSAAKLSSALVEAPDFGTMEREGFMHAYMYLTAGSYNLVEVEEKAIKTTLGGALSTVSGDDINNKECDEENSNYSLVSVTTDGAAFEVATEGLYVVAYDATSSELVIDHMESAGIIGAATPDGWGGDTKLEGTVSATSASWKLEEVTLNAGEMKYRFNCRWGIDRRLDASAPFDNSNGYSFFTNFGGSFADLLPGNEGSNMVIDEYAVYTVTLDWDVDAGFTASATKTGEAVVKPEYGDMYLVGAGTAYGWDTPGTHVNALMHKIAGGSPNEGIYWKICYLEAGQGFKISAENWNDPNLGHGGVTEYDANGVAVTDNGGNMDVAASGMYMIVLNLQDDMTKVSITTPEVYGIGDAFGGWDEDMAAAAYTVDNEAKTLTSPAFSADGTVRSYVHHAWISDWWNAEFVVVSDAIEYRNDSGDDPTAVAGTTGQVMTFTFDDNTGSIQ